MTTTMSEPPLEAYEPGSPRPFRGGAPKPIGAILGLFIARQPVSRRAHVADQIKAGREAAEAGTVDHVVVDVPPADEVVRRQRQIRAEALDKILVENRELARAGLDSLDPDQHPKELAKWLNDPDALTLLLAGRTGSGKTQASVAAAVHACQHGAAGRNRRGEVVQRHLLVRSWTTIGYVAALRPDGAPEPVWAIRDKARTAELLILDDLGAATYDTASQHVSQELLELLSYRLERRFRTIFTTNLPSVDIKARYGDPFFSRLQESATLLKYLGHDRRQVNRLEW